MNLKNRLTKIYLQKINGLTLPRDLIRCAVKKHYEKIAVICGERKISYGELYKRAKKLVGVILKLGLHKGDKLGVLLYNCQEYFEIRIATYLTGIVLVPIVWDMGLEDIIFILNDCEIKILIYHHEILDKEIERLKIETGVSHFIEIASGLSSSTARVRNNIEYENLLSQSEPVEPKTKIKGIDLASINFSSGTTGRPKGIMLLQKNWMNSFYNYVLNSTGTRICERIILHTLSFATAGGTAFLPSFFLGFKNIIIDRFSTEKAIHPILKYKVNSLFISPSYFIILLDYCKNRRIGLPLTGIVLGTEPMPQAKLKEAIEFFGPVIQEGYGMAEVLPPLSLMSPLLSRMNREKVNEKSFLSCGRVIEGIRLKIIDKNGKALSPLKVGNIIIKSGTISAGYWNNPELTRQHYKNGWFYTNDYGYLDEDGYLYILGRKEDILKEDSENIIFTRQVEEVLHKHKDVLEVCVFRSDKIIACVSLRSNSGRISSQELIKFYDDMTENDEAPQAIYIYPELPKNASGKLDRKRIKSELLWV